jgi:hypothetical protein
VEEAKRKSAPSERGEECAAFGRKSGRLGYMFWAAECQGTHSVCTTPPNTCQGGVGVGAKTYNIPIPMPPLRQN